MKQAFCACASLEFFDVLPERAKVALNTFVQEASFELWVAALLADPDSRQLMSRAVFSSLRFAASNPNKVQESLLRVMKRCTVGVITKPAIGPG